MHMHISDKTRTVGQKLCREYKKTVRGCLPLQRAVPGEGALVEGTAGASREALLVDGVQEGTRRSRWGAAPLLGPLHFLPSAEAK